MEPVVVGMIAWPSVLVYGLRIEGLFKESELTHCNSKSRRHGKQLSIALSSRRCLAGGYLRLRQKPLCRLRFSGGAAMGDSPPAIPSLRQRSFLALGGVQPLTPLGVENACPVWTT